MSKEKACKELAAAASQKAPFADAFREPILLQNDRGQAIFLVSRQYFSAELVTVRGTKSYKPVKTGDFYSLFLPIYSNAGDPGNGQLVITIGNDRMIQKFTKE